MTTQILPTEKLYAGQYTKSEWLQLTPAERREISYKRYLQNVANAPKVNYDSFILSALYEIIHYISNGLFEAFSVVKGDVTANVIVEDENNFVIKIQTPTQYFHISDDKDLFFTKLNVKTFEKLVGAKTVKMLKSELPNETVSTTNEVFEIGKSSCKKLSVIQIKTYSNPKDCLSTFPNAFYPYWIAKYANDNTAYFAPVNAIDFKINLEYFNGFEFFAVESKKEKKSYITVYEKSTGFKVVESWVCFLDSELTKRSQCDVEFSGLLKSAINNLPFTIEPNESIESINQKRIAQNEIYVFGTTPEVELIAETQPETNEENEIESESEINQEPTNQNETMQPAQPQTLEVNQVIQCDGYRLVVTAVKEAKQSETQPTQEPANEPTQEPSSYKQLWKVDTEGAIHLGQLSNLAYRAYLGTSMSPEKRASDCIKSYDKDLIEFLAEIPVEHQTWVKGKYISLFTAWLSAKSRCISSFIAGPSNFPVSHAQKYNNWEHGAYEAFVEWKEKTVKRLNRKEKVSIDLELIETENTIEQLKANQQIMKDCNKVVQSKKMSNEEKIEELENLGLSKANASKLLTPDYCNRLGFRGFELTNNNARIKHYEEKLEKLQNRINARNEETKETTINGVRIVENIEADRLQIFFDGIPAENIRKSLKSNGFRWSPSNGCWQSYLQSGKYKMSRLVLS